jgi:hypothetical protein
MPAVSEAQRRLLYARFGAAWVRAHHFDTPGKLPRYVRKRRRPTTVTTSLTRGGSK